MNLTGSVRDCPRHANVQRRILLLKELIPLSIDGPIRFYPRFKKQTKGKKMDGSDDTGECPSVNLTNTSGCKKDSDANAADSLSQRGAMALAKRLQEFWHSQGYPAARFWAEPVGERFAKVGTYELYRVASNLVNGMPPRYRDDSVRR